MIRIEVSLNISTRLPGAINDGTRVPMAITIIWLSWPVFLDAYRSNEVSANAGGLAIWPARLMVPIGFLLLVAQGVSELIKRIAFLRGLIPDPSEKDEGPSAEEQLAAELRDTRQPLTVRLRDQHLQYAITWFGLAAMVAAAAAYVARYELRLRATLRSR